MSHETHSMEDRHYPLINSPYILLGIRFPVQIIQCSLTNTLDEVQILGQQVFKVFLNQHLADVQPNAGLAVVVVVVQVVRFGRNIQDRFELNLSLHISTIWEENIRNWWEKDSLPPPWSGSKSAHQKVPWRWPWRTSGTPRRRWNLSLWTRWRRCRWGGASPTYPPGVDSESMVTVKRDSVHETTGTFSVLGVFFSFSSSTSTPSSEVSLSSSSSSSGTSTTSTQQENKFVKKFSLDREEKWNYFHPPVVFL